MDQHDHHDKKSPQKTKNSVCTIVTKTMKNETLLSAASFGAEALGVFTTTSCSSINPGYPYFQLSSKGKFTRSLVSYIRRATEITQEFANTKAKRIATY